MRVRRLLSIALLAVSIITPMRRVAAQDITAATKLWVDSKTGQVFVRPGKGRVPFTLGGPVDQRAIEQNVEQKVEARTNDQIKTQVQQSAAQLQEQNQVLAQQVNEMQPAWKSYTDDFRDKIRLGTVLFGDYRFYTNTGFQPQEQENLSNLGPGNNNYNSFDITRAYLNFFFFPTKTGQCELPRMSTKRSVHRTIRSDRPRVSAATWTAISACA